MKKIQIIHGWESSPDEPILKWLKFSLQKKGFEVSAPDMPEPEKPKIETWVGKLKEVVSPDKETILVGHSIGCQAILRYLETLPEGTKVAGIILIAPFITLNKKQ